MVKKRAKKGEVLGVSGFTLGIVSFVLVVFSPFLGIALSLIGFSFCFIQQRRNPTKFGKRGMIINVIGFLVNITWMIILVSYIIPILQEQLGQLNQGI